MKSYPALRTIAVFFKILAWISLIGGALAFIGGLVWAFVGGNGEQAQAIATALFAPLLGLLYFVMFYASSEMIYVLIDISDNTKRTAELLAQGAHTPAPQLVQQAPPPAAPAAQTYSAQQTSTQQQVPPPPPPSA